MTWSQQSNFVGLEIERASGNRFITQYGEIIDFSSVSFHASFGWDNPIIVNSLKEQLDHYYIAHPKSVAEQKKRVSCKLLNYFDLHENGRLFYTTSGSESVENAIKLAREVRKAPIILARKASYHGATLGSMSISGDGRADPHFTVDDWTRWIPTEEEDPDLKIFDRIIAETGAHRIAAVCLETVTGASGVKQFSEDWIMALSERCDRYGILKIFDEVIAAFHRTGSPLALKQFTKLSPDLICLSKSMTGGAVPFGAVWVNEKVASLYDHRQLNHGLTNYAHPLGLAATEAVLNILESKQVQEKIESFIDDFSQKIKSLSAFNNIKQVRLKGLLAAIELENEIPLMSFLNEGLYLYQKKNRIVLAPALTMPKADWEEGFIKLKNCLQGTRP